MLNIKHSANWLFVEFIIILRCRFVYDSWAQISADVCDTHQQILSRLSFEPIVYVMLVEVVKPPKNNISAVPNVWISSFNIQFNFSIDNSVPVESPVDCGPGRTDICSGLGVDWNAHSKTLRPAKKRKRTQATTVLYLRKQSPFTHTHLARRRRNANQLLPHECGRIVENEQRICVQ